jgi:hypothetical protein
VNTLAVLAHVSQGTEARSIVEKTFSEQGLAQASIYFRAYTNAALREVGLGDRYLDVLQPWHEMLASGLTTWSEINGPFTRSDCHAWGASPNFELFRTVAGIEPASPGYRRVRIAPNLGSLPAIHARVPHPQGEITVDFSVANGSLSGTISLPAGVPGVLVWHGHERQLHPGKNTVKPVS